MLKGNIRFFLCLFLFSTLAFIPVLDPILKDTGADVFAQARWNQPPVAEDQNVVAKAGKEKVIILRAIDHKGDRLKYEIVNPPEHGKLKGNPPVVTYRPDTGFHGWDRFTFKANNGQLDSNVAEVRIKVEAVNHAPHAMDQEVKTGPDQPIKITLQATDRDGDVLTFRIVDDPAHGTLSGSPPIVTYTPKPGYQGWDKFIFKASDGRLNSNVAEVFIQVLAGNHVPAAQNQSVSTDEGTAKVITLLATDPDGNPLTYQVVSQPAHGTLSGTPPGVTYTPTSGYRGLDSFTFKANDGKADSNLATVSITVLAVNHAPVAQNQSVSMDEGTAKAVTLSATDSDGDTLTYLVVSQPAHGTLSGAAPNVTYSPETGYRGPDSFTFKANDGKVDSNTATISITVVAVNHAPVAQDQIVTIEAGTIKIITLVATDSDGDTLTYQIVSQPAHGILSGTPPTVTYTSDATYQGSDNFTFNAYDGKSYSNPATISITLTPANRLSITFPQDGGIIQRSDIRVEGKIVSTGGETGVVVNGILANVYGDTFVANHVPLVEGANTITATATDGQGNTVIATVTVNAVPAKDYIRVMASSEAGIAPLEAFLTMDSSLDLTNASLTYEGTGEVELVKTDAKEYKVNIQAEGIYTFTARVSDSTGTFYEDKIDIIAVSKAELENRLVSRWEGMKGALLGGNIKAALSFFVPGTQDRYRQVFEELGSDRINSIFSTIIGVELDTSSGGSAEGGLIREEDGKIYSYPITYVQDQNGLWKIMGF